LHWTGVDCADAVPVAAPMAKTASAAATLRLMVFGPFVRVPIRYYG
jgi:hypothetical protein